ncbi:MAG: alpha-galactosidase [Clostridia bacterium]|nr:alpha-galactosidase [Clostridia bacterium]
MAIYFDVKTKTFYLESKNLTYAFCVDQAGFLNHLYFGKRIAREELGFSVHSVDRGHGAYPPDFGRDHSLSIFLNECPTYGRSDYRESMLAFDFDGVRVGDLVYDGYTVYETKPLLSGMPSVRGGETLAVSLKDVLHGARVVLYYTVFEELPVILRHAEVVNESDEAFMLDRAYSFCLDFPDKNWETVTLHGAHLRERFMERTSLSHGVFSVDSKRGVSSAQMNPFMAIVRKNTDEETGEAYGFNLVYSGDFTFKAQIEQDDSLRVLGGLNDYDFSWLLKAGEKFVTPEAVMVYSENGLGDMSRSFHDLYRTYLINPRFVNASRPIVINNWEATYMNFDTQKLCEIVDSVRGTGIDTFVLDDGWFGARNTDKAGLGDWVVNEKKVDLKKVIDYTHKNGLKFGLWFEPEMVNKDSELYRAHPDWAIHADGLEPCLGRDQLVLDLTRDEVRQYVIDSVSAILNAYEIDYVKWDMNRPLTDNYSAWLKKQGKEFHHRYVLGLYQLCEALVNGFPSVFFEGCASGGCRFDPAMLYYFPQIWTSDDTDAYMRTFIQYGTSLCYPLSAHSCHVSVCPNHQCGRVTPFASRGHVAHLGATGYELDTAKMTQEELQEVKKQVEEYKAMEALVLHGDLYRLNDPAKENLFAEMLVSKDKTNAHLTVFRPFAVPNGPAIRVYPRGLKDDATYYIPELDLTRTGATLMRVGLLVCLNWEDFASATYRFIEK